jgi:SNF2 family DNA or RNA helicase
VHEGKLDALEEIMEEWVGQPILVAYQFKADAQRILKRFKNARMLDHNPKTIKDWNEGRIPMLVAHPASAGHGLNLQRGSNVLVYYGSGWNFEEDAQIAERIGPVRQLQAGLHRLVYVYRIVAEGTIDEEVLEVLAQKCTVQEALMNAMKRRGSPCEE